MRENGKFVGYINIVKNKGRRYNEKDKKEECPIPDYSVEYLEKYRETLMESVAETSEEFMDRYFGGEEFSVAEISAALAMNEETAPSFRYAWAPRSICRAYRTLLMISADTSRIRPPVRVPASISIRTKFSRQIMTSRNRRARPFSRRSWIRSLENIQ